MLYGIVSSAICTSSGSLYERHFSIPHMASLVGKLSPHAPAHNCPASISLYLSVMINRQSLGCQKMVININYQKLESHIDPSVITSCLRPETPQQENS